MISSAFLNKAANFGNAMAVHRMNMEVTQMDTLALIVSIIGCLNWGLVGIFGFDLVAWLFGGQDSVVSRIIYALVGLAGLWCITLLFRKGQRAEGE